MTRTKKISKSYDKNVIFDTLNKLEITQKDNTVLTHFDNKLVSNTLVTDKYKIFDFSTFSKKVIDQIENYFTPETYNLRITQGTQELRLIGEEVIINGERYSKMFNILNSTDKSRSLQLNVGLIRFICSNGMVVAAADEYSGLKTRHLESTLTEKVEQFINSLDSFDMNIQKQSEVLENLTGRFVSFKELAEKLAFDDDGVMSNSRSLKLRAFAKKLLTSETDRLVDLHSEQKNLLRNANLFLNPEYNKIDIEMPAYRALNCWTEVYRNYDSSVLKRETNRILELV